VAHAVDDQGGVTILAGGDDGMVGYLVVQAKDNPQSFLPLLGKVLPMQVVGDAENPISFLLKIGGEKV
jgi:hypothetical protein